MDNVRQMTKSHPQSEGHFSRKEKKGPVFHVSNSNFFCMHCVYNAQISMISVAIIDFTISSKPT